MFGSIRWRNQFSSLLLTLIPMRFPNSLRPSEAFLLSARRSHKYLASSETILPIQCNDSKDLSTRCRFTSLAVSDAELCSDLARNIRESYIEKETDGILELAASSSMMVDEELDIEGALIPAILDASRGNKGVAASIMNALIGSSCNSTNSADWAQNGKPNLLSSRILLLIEGLQKTGDIVPDIVTYSLAHQALSINPNCHNLAAEVLEEAEKLSKRIAGGKRRKLLASARRRKISTFVDAEASLKDILGDDFKLLLETDRFAVVNKPSGVSCFHKKKTTAGKIKKGKGKNKREKSNKSLELSDFSLEDALISCNVELSTLNPDALGLVHRLDRGSSGCIVLAKSNEIHAKLISEFFLRRTTKQYTALVRESPTSTIPEEGCGLIDNPVNGRPARSQYSILERYQSSSEDESEDDASIVEFEIFTGRKHQIRVHAAEVLGSPVWGDPLYGADNGRVSRSEIGSDTSKRIFLHASRLKIPGLGIDVESPHPVWWQSTLSNFKSKQID
jgi:23S rRNA pseudouridine1911/1915/1917 synthase